MGNFIPNPPDAKALMEAARSFGNYDLASAIADLIDNSITAHATRVEVVCLWNDGIPEIRVRDDGYGMSEETLIRAMRPASTSPVSERSPNDLGRFGLGLKTASLSQCRRLTVVTVADGKWSGARWDLDQIQDWSMELLSEAEIQEATKIPGAAKSGTEVIWSKLDRLTEDGALRPDSFNALVDYARNALALIYHRYIDPEIGFKRVIVELNGTKLKAFDPFHERHPASQALSSETIQMRNGAEIQVSPFILPHYSKLTAGEYESLAGEEGYLRNQGFYVYRNRRLIIHGTWFRLIRHGDLSKLARVRIDIPNSLDADWKITVDKSGAQIPSLLRDRLRSLIDRIRDYSGDVYRSRGARIGLNGRGESVWLRSVVHGTISYRINRTHPVIVQTYALLNDVEKATIDDVLSLVERSFPIDTLFADAGDNPKSISLAATEPDEVRNMTRRFITRFMENGGTRNALLAILSDAEPFKGNQTIISEELERAGVSSV